MAGRSGYHSFLQSNKNSSTTPPPARTNRLKPLPKRPEKLDLSRHMDLLHQRHGQREQQIASQSKTTTGRVSQTLPAAVLNKPLPRIQAEDLNCSQCRRDFNDTRWGSISHGHSRRYHGGSAAHNPSWEAFDRPSHSTPPSPDYDEAPHSGNSMIVPIGMTRSPGHTLSPVMPGLTHSTSGSSGEYTDIVPPDTATPWVDVAKQTDLITSIDQDTDDSSAARDTNTSFKHPESRSEAGNTKTQATKCRVLNCNGYAYQDGVCLECLEGPELSMFGDSPPPVTMEHARCDETGTELATGPIRGGKHSSVYTGDSRSCSVTQHASAPSGQDGSARKSPCDDLLEQVSRQMAASLRHFPNALSRPTEDVGKQDVEQQAATYTNGQHNRHNNHSRGTDSADGARNSPKHGAIANPAIRPVSLTSRFNSDSSLQVRPLRLTQRRKHRNLHVYNSSMPYGDVLRDCDYPNPLPQSRPQPASAAPSPTVIESPSFAAQQRLRASGGSSAYRAPFETTGPRHLHHHEPGRLQARTYTAPLRHKGSLAAFPFSSATSTNFASTSRAAAQDQQREQIPRRRPPKRREYGPQESYFEFSSAEPSRNPSRVPSMEFGEDGSSAGAGVGGSNLHHEVVPCPAAMVEHIRVRMGSCESWGEGGQRDAWTIGKKALPRLPLVFDVWSGEEYPGPCPGEYWF